MMSATDGDVT